MYISQVTEILTYFSSLSTRLTPKTFYFYETEIWIIVISAHDNYEISFLSNETSSFLKSPQTFQGKLQVSFQLFLKLTSEGLVLISIFKPYQNLKIITLEESDLHNINTLKSQNRLNSVSEHQNLATFVGSSPKSLMFSSSLYFASKINAAQFQNLVAHYFQLSIKSVFLQKTKIQISDFCLNLKICCVLVPSVIKEDGISFIVNFGGQILWQSDFENLLSKYFSPFLEDFCKMCKFSEVNRLNVDSMFLSFRMKKTVIEAKREQKMLTFLIICKITKNAKLIDVQDFFKDEVIREYFNYELGKTVEKFKLINNCSFFENKNEIHRRNVLENEVNEIVDLIIAIDLKLGHFYSFETLESERDELCVHKLNGINDLKERLKKAILFNLLKLKS